VGVDAPAQPAATPWRCRERFVSGCKRCVSGNAWLSPRQLTLRHAVRENYANNPHRGASSSSPSRTSAK
jgi:hypothetical protein